ncbi:MAG: alanine--tRNA ligase [Alphaproteobacteria bacterium]
MAGTNEIRSRFLEYFAAHDHEVVSSGPLVPHNDPTLLFTSAGMVQFKNVFTGSETRPYVRAVSSQKCLRAGGKHNDLENVGYTARHHTFFEMLGNFSFGDYFKDLAIELAWNLVTREYGLSEDRLLVTVYSEDDEAFNLWRKIAGLADDRIIRIPTSDNFWAMGETGPCGPCSEIFYDHGEHLAGGPPGSEDDEGDRFVEIWNLVFMQFDQPAPGRRVKLPRPSIDTGMGLERIAAVLQGRHDNYDTDILRSLIEASAEASDTPADGEHAVSHRVIADHVRACSFLIADGVLPSNEGRGYVLRRIMRRAMRHVHRLGCREPLMHRLVPTLVQLMGQPFPELTRAAPLIGETFELEEERFRRTLDRGLRMLDEETASLSEGEALSGEVAFRLYDTYGFPIDLTQDILRGQARKVDIGGFEAAMARQREAARKAWAGSGEAATEELWYDIREDAGATEFLGYATDVAEAQIAALVADGSRIERADAGQEVAVVVNQTPFYGEAGGQVGDTGVMFTADGAELAIADTQRKLNDLFVHLGRVTKGSVSAGDVVELRIDADRRTLLRANHSATHLLHQALRRRLGERVVQKGSLVAPDRLRFDFSYPKAVPREELHAIEDLVNARILANSEVRTRLMAPDRAMAAGALALFGEKYGEEVRVVSMGADGDGAGEFFSTELCGGTHVRRTGDIGVFKIVSESAVAAGVRRIEALTGEAARAYLDGRDRLIQEVADVLRSSPDDAPTRVATLLEERRRLERELVDARRHLATAGGREIAAPPAKEIAGIRYAARRLRDVPAKELRSVADAMKKQVGSGVVAVATVDDGKASLVVGVTDDLVDRFSAVDLVRVGVARLGGKGGGGRPDLAQGGGPDVAGADSALAAIEQALAG